MKYWKFNIGYLTTLFSLFLTSFQYNEIFQVIQLVLTIVSLLITIAYSVWTWYKKAAADGKITTDEIKDGINIVADGVEEIKDAVDNSSSTEK